MPQSHFVMVAGDEAPARVDITITRADLAEAGTLAVPRVSRRDARAIVDQMFEEVSAALAKNETVKLHTFGTFVIRNKRERLGRNPRTGKSVEIEPRAVVAFKASPQMREAIANGYAHLLGEKLPSLQSDGAPFTPARRTSRSKVLVSSSDGM